MAYKIFTLFSNPLLYFSNEIFSKHTNLGRKEEFPCSEN